MKITFYTPKILPRIRYIVSFLLGEQLGLTISFTDDARAFAKNRKAKINYSSERLAPEELFIPQHSLLRETGIVSQNITIFQHNNLPAFFEKKVPQTDLPFDLFAFSFYLLSRYEEYLPFEADAHGRFPATESLAYRHGFLQQPLVDLWALELKKRLQLQFPQLEFPTRTAHFLPTYDIDQAWAYRHKSWWRTLGSLAKALGRKDWLRLRERWQVHLQQQPDPFFTFPYLDDLHEQFELRPIYFFLVGEHGAFDKNIDPERPAFRQIIQQLSERYPVGIHPSYQSNADPTLVLTELQRLRSITGRTVTQSRQHFLKLRFPQTYRQLLEAGIQQDYSMGYAAQTGFRASTAHPFLWYDLENETATNLRVYPFQAMDVTLRKYLGLSPKAALEHLEQLWQTTQAVQGTFVTLWHNSSFSVTNGWRGWPERYVQLLDIVTSRQDS